MADAVAENTALSPGPPRKGWLGRQFDSAVKAGIRGTARVLFGARIRGLEHFKAAAGQPMVIVPNHTSLLDPVLIAATLPVEPAIAIDKTIHEKFSKNPVVNFFFKRMSLYPLDPANPRALRDLTRLAQSGKPVLIYPEGRLTRTGTLGQIFGGAAVIADNAKASFVPIYVDGLQRLPTASDLVKTHPRQWFPRVTMMVDAPQKLDLPDGIGRRDRRAARDRQLEAIMQSLPLKALDKNKSLIDTLHDAAKIYGRGRAVLEDPETPALSYRKVLTGAYAIGDRLAQHTAKGENVGFLLPNSVGASVTFWGLQAYGRVPALLNAKAEISDMMSYTRTASLRTVVTSRRFVAMAKLEKKIEALAGQCKIVYLEDLKQEMGFGTKFKSFLRAQGWMPHPRDRGVGADPAAIVFTSGSEGPPKGVVLSSANFLSNITQICAVTPILPSDRVFNAMPVFHSFGLTGGLIMPLLRGVASYQYPTPLDGKMIPKMIYEKDATILFGTDTFLNLYARNASDMDLSGLRMVFAGAEALKPETYNMYVDRFGVRINQAYGMTEASPAVAINTPTAHRRGSVGRFLPGIETRLEDAPGIDSGKRLYIRGPNVMLGYLTHDRPDVIQPPKDGWHDTGDIVTVDRDGFVTLAGRAKRFAKIGGEMVSLDGVEAIARAASRKPNAEQAVILRQDADIGDSIVLFTTDPDLKRDGLARAAQELQKSVLGLPKNRDIHVLAALPKLPTGKPDYMSLKRLYNAMAQNDGPPPPPAAPEAPRPSA